MYSIHAYKIFKVLIMQNICQVRWYAAVYIDVRPHEISMFSQKDNLISILIPNCLTDMQDYNSILVFLRNLYIFLNSWNLSRQKTEVN